MKKEPEPWVSLIRNSVKNLKDGEAKIVSYDKNSNTAVVVDKNANVMKLHV